MIVSKTVIAINVFALVGAIIWAITAPTFEPIVTSLALSGTLIASLREYFKRREKKTHPTSQKLALVGFLGSGKTTYLAVLFTELQIMPKNDIWFGFDDYKSIEKINRIMMHLGGRDFPISTGPEEVSFYTCSIYTKRGLSQKKYSLEVADLSGESFDTLSSGLQNGPEYWLHKNPYFNQLLESSAILITIDVTEVLKKKKAIHWITYSFIALINVMCKIKNIPENRRVDKPICILFMKSDVLLKKNMTEKQVILDFSDLLSYIKKKFKYVKHFFVSSLGDQFFETKKIRPYNVVEPILWLLEVL